MSKYTIVTLNDEQLYDWEQFLDDPENLTSLYASSRWGKALEAASGSQFRVHALMKQGRIVGGVAGHYQRVYGLKVFKQIPLAPYNGMCQISLNDFEVSKRERFINEGQFSLGRFLKKEYHLVSLLNCPQIHDLRGFYWAGFRLEKRYTYLVDLAEVDTLWKNLNPDVRTKVRKAERLGWEFQVSREAAVMISLLQETAQRQKFHLPYSAPSLRSILERLLAENLLRIFTVSIEGAPAAAVAVFQDKHGVLHEWLAGTQVAESTAGAFQFLLWKIIDFYAALGQGWRWLDMDGANIKSISYMKSHFSGRLLPVTHVISPALAILQITRHLALNWKSN